MFGVEARNIVEALGAEKTLIPNKDLLLNVELMTLVKVRKKGFFEVPEYEPLNIKLPQLLIEEPALYCDDKVLVKDFRSVSKVSGTASVGGGHGDVGAEISGGGDRLDGLTEPVSLMKKEVHVLGKSFSKFNKNKVKELKPKKTEKLALVNQIVYNTGDVQIIRASKKEGSVSAFCEKLFSLSLKGSKEKATSFTVPEKSTFAYGLAEIMIEEDKLEIPNVGYKIRLSSIFQTLYVGTPPPQSDPEVLAMKELEMNLSKMQPLADLPESTRRELLKKLCDVLKNQDDLSELEETLDQSIKGTYERPQSQTISSFLDVLDVSNVSSDVKTIVYMLVSALNALPDEVPTLLVTCDVEVLDFFIYKATNWRNIHREAPAVVKNEFSWMLDFMETTKKTEDDEDEEDYDGPVIFRFPLEKLREMVCVAMKGIKILRS
ncbi:uncharacterized protein LOC125013060 [Mugil cephalus]|uniref:uncharacterized protein LOC125013060 n=1 Tax=Mugil cephalus TaxID=48193 RepID=UPI001FB80B99|nr:uncharacterized protein LOC125013060 [Mugil cephalus]